MAYIWGAPKWILINVGFSILFTILCLLVGKSLRKRSEATEAEDTEVTAEA